MAEICIGAALLAGALYYRRRIREAERKRHGRRPTSDAWFV